MDNLTHSLVGLLLARVAMPANLPRRQWLGVVAANAPDLDLIVSLTPAAYLVAHRHLTHAVVAIPVMAALSVLLVRLFARLWARYRRTPYQAPPFGAAWLWALVPAASHPLLDWTNSYAIRPWLPFDASWSSGNLLFVIEPWLWAALALAAAAPLLSGRRALRTASAAGLLAVTGYALWQAQVRNAALAALAREPADRIAAFPAPFEPTVRVVYVEEGASQWVGPFQPSTEAAVDRRSLQRFDRPPQQRAVEAAWAAPLGRSYRQFSIYPLEWVEPTERGWRVILSDARFVRGDQAGFACVFELTHELQVLSSEFSFGVAATTSPSQPKP
ncbi:MAG: hypothetical protein GC160_28220 [Acidobacteria bacterium]|nr:hypothetical protein [Acidobacteriota bacterium]